MNQNIGTLYLNAFEASLPAIFLVIFGVIIGALNIFPASEQTLLGGIAFKFGLTIKGIEIIAQSQLQRDDWLIVAAMLVVTFLSIILIVPVLFLYPKNERFKAFAAIFCTICVNNCVISGIPVFSGLYDPALVEKYSYLQLLALFGFALIPTYIFFEISYMGTGTQGDVKKRNIIFTILHALLKTIEQPLIIGVILGLIGNALVSLAGMKIPNCYDYFFTHMGYLSGPLGLMMLGLFFYENMHKKFGQNRQRLQLFGVQQNKDKYKKNIPLGHPSSNKQQLIAFIVVCIFVQFTRHLILPIAVAGFCYLFGVQDQQAVELSVGIYASPTAVFSFVLCDTYGYGSGIAGVDAVLGLITGFLVIPILQVVCNALWTK